MTSNQQDVMTQNQNVTPVSSQRTHSRLHSIQTQILAMVTVILVVSISVLLLLYTHSVRQTITDITSSYMEDIADSYGTLIDKDLQTNGKDTALSADTLKDRVADVKINNMDTSYIYIVSGDGTMLYHPAADKIGQPVENAVVKADVEQIAQGTIPENQMISYDFQGTEKWAATYIGKEGAFILVVTADAADAHACLTSLNTKGTACGVIALFVSLLIAFFVARFIIRPINQITQTTIRLAEMDFAQNADEKLLDQRKDETGRMSRALSTLRAELQNVVSSIKEQSGHLAAASETLEQDAGKTAETVDQVERTVSEIADGATSQAQDTQKATQNVIVMGDMIQSTNEEMETLFRNTTQMKEAGQSAKNTLQDLNTINQKAMDAIDIIYEQTNTTNESAQKIREAITLITSIAEETNLLSLNASIEAARAGEQGRGFAVVASQIQKLAEQSNDSAKQIETIIASLMHDSENAVHTMDDVREIVKEQNTHLQETDKAFASILQGVDLSMQGMDSISSKTQKLDEARVRVVDVVQNLTAIAEENAASTQETSASITQVSNTVYGISEQSQQLKQIADELEDVMRIFRL